MAFANSKDNVVDSVMLILALLVVSTVVLAESKLQTSDGIFLKASTLQFAELKLTNPTVSPKAIRGIRSTQTNRFPLDNLDNWDFEYGLLNWQPQGNAFASQPTYGDNVVASRVIGRGTPYRMPLGGDYWRQVAYPIGHHLNRWIGTYENRMKKTDMQGQVAGDGPTGSLTSKPFTIENNFITFLISGGEDLQRLRVELLLKISAGDLLQERALHRNRNTSTKNTIPSKFIPFSDGNYRRYGPALTSTGHGNELMRREWWDVAHIRGKTVRIRILDQSSATGGHINVDDFTFQDVAPDAIPAASGGPTVVRWGTRWVDRNAPIWGVTDLHTHPLSHLAFGKKLMFGRPDGDMMTELESCLKSHGSWDPGNTEGNTIRALIANSIDEQYDEVFSFDPLEPNFNTMPGHPSAGAPAFIHWPKFNSVTHQQMRWEWVKRAWEGGLRVMVSLAVNSHLLAAAIDGDAPLDDKASADLQLDEMVRYFSWIRRQPGGDFVEIAYSSADLRRIVRDGKLAIVMGIEVDNIGNFNFAGTDRSRNAVRAELQRLHTKGVRYIFPVHATDNPFGGAAVYEDLFNLANRFNAVQPAPHDVGAVVPGTAFSIMRSPDPLVTKKLEPLTESVFILGLRGALEGMERLPTPVLNPCFPCGDLIAFGRCELAKGSLGLGNLAYLSVCMNPTLLVRDTFNPGQYSLLKNYALTPDPLYETYRTVPRGHQNSKPITDLGLFAVREMMRLGMIVDIDHMSDLMATAVLNMAESMPTPVPVASGHTGFRSMQSGEGTNENQRSNSQLETLSRIDGIMGVGWGYAKAPDRHMVQSFDTVISAQGGRQKTSSIVRYDDSNFCGGTSRTFAQNYLYAIEKLPGVALGTDINGFVPTPGPRFGPLSTLDGNRCVGQDHPVNYPGSGFMTDPPLLPSSAGDRTWNINRDGVAHYGLLPDFLQDLSNVGINSVDMFPLFNSAEYFATMWERIERAGPTIPRG